MEALVGLIEIYFKMLAFEPLDSHNSGRGEDPD